MAAEVHSGSGRHDRAILVIATAFVRTVGKLLLPGPGNRRPSRCRHRVLRLAVKLAERGLELRRRRVRPGATPR
jgi:hypothetical protein